MILVCIIIKLVVVIILFGLLIPFAKHLLLALSLKTGEECVYILESLLRSWLKLWRCNGHLWSIHHRFWHWVILPRYILRWHRHRHRLPWYVHHWFGHWIRFTWLIGLLRFLDYFRWLGLGLTDFLLLNSGCLFIYLVSLLLLAHYFHFIPLVAIIDLTL